MELHKTKSTIKNNNFVNAVKSGLRDLKKEIKEISEDKIENEKLDEIVNLVEKILEFNNQNQNQEGNGLKILIPKEMRTRLRITLAQLKVGNNSEKLKHETTPLLHTLHRSKNLPKTIYNNLINTI